jgi:glucose 1-dehydrogenase
MMQDATRERYLEGRWALVTGASRGIGRAICDSLAARGANIIVHYNKHIAEAREFCASLTESHGVRAVPIGANLALEDDIDSLFAAVKRETLALHVLINNAGYEDCHAAESMPVSAWDFVMGVNLRGPFLCCQRAFPLLQAAGGGVILNNSSIHDDVPRKGIVHYCCAKAGLHMLTKCLALEWAEHSIRVNTVSPGAIATDMNRRVINDEQRYQFAEWIPAGRVGEVEEVAELFAYLASPQAAYITGNNIQIDGGYRLSTIRYDDRPERHK